MSGFDNGVVNGLGLRLDPADAREFGIMQRNNDQTALMNVSGDPNGVVPANPGSLAQDRTNGDLYLKVSGTGDTVWEKITTGTSLIGLDPDVGATVVPDGSGNIAVLGYTTGTVDTITTYNTGVSEFKIDNRTYFTPYVVDANSTPGQQGTFTTIQSAIDQAVADGNSYSFIYIRPGLYTEDITLYSGINLVGQFVADYEWIALNPLDYLTTIVGTVNFDTSIVVATAQNLAFGTNSSSPVVDVNDNNIKISFKRCAFYSQSTGNIITTTGNTTNGRYVNFSDCIFSGSGSVTYDLNFTAQTNISFNNCTFGSIPYFSIGSSTVNMNVPSNSFVTMYNCFCMGQINSTGTVNLNIINTTFNSKTGGSGVASYYISGTADTTNIYNCTFGIKDTLGPTSGFAIQSTIGPVRMANNTAYDCILYQDATDVEVTDTLQGNVVAVTTDSVSHVMTVNEYYLGITSTASPRTVTLPNPNTICEGRTFYIKDESGGAGTNAITVTPAAGNIDGIGSATINTNYGSIHVIKRGSNYFTI